MPTAKEDEAPSPSSLLSAYIRLLFSSWEEVQNTEIAKAHQP